MSLRSGLRTRVSIKSLSYAAYTHSAWSTRSHLPKFNSEGLAKYRTYATDNNPPPGSDARTSNVPWGEPITKASPSDSTSSSKTTPSGTQASGASPSHASNSDTTAKASAGGAGSTAGAEPASPEFEEFVEREEATVQSKYAPVWTALAIITMSLAAFGLGRVWHDMPMWPREVRRDLFSGFQATRRGDNTMGVLNLSRAWETAKSLPVEKFGEYPFLKLSGIAIALAGAYDASGNTELAYEIYQEALSQLQDFTTPGAESSDASSRSLRGDLSTAERVRAVAISAKLGELARKLHKPPMEEEKWLAYSVETVLRDIMGVESVKNEVTAKDRDSDEIAKDVTEAMKLPPLWALRHDLAAPFEALGSFYARNGNPKFAMPLYFQAISLLMPPSPQVTSRRDKCRAAHIMGQISELIIRAGSDGAGVDHQALVEAETWAKTGLGITTEARRSFKEREGICEVAYAFMLYNLALIRELSGDQSKARELFVESLDQSKAIGFREGIKNAEKAIRVVGQEPVTISSLLPY